MGIFSGLFRSRDKPKDSYDSPSYSYFFGRTHAGKRVNDRTAMQIIAVYVDSIIVYTRTCIGFRLRCGLTLKEEVCTGTR